MIRKIIHIDQEKCNGCGACADACHEGAIQMIDGKARLIRDDYCDGLGDCLPACPTGAISFEEREAAAYDHEAVQRHLASRKAETFACPSSLPTRLQPAHVQPAHAQATGLPLVPRRSQLGQWPVQIKLAPVSAPYFDEADLLIAADCSAYAYADFHEDFLRGRIALIGCPKLDAVDYAEKLAEILSRNEVRSLTIVRMEVPCCGGLEHAAANALKASGRQIPWRVVTIGIQGDVKSDLA